MSVTLDYKGLQKGFDDLDRLRDELAALRLVAEAAEYMIDTDQCSGACLENTKAKLLAWRSLTAPAERGEK